MAKGKTISPRDSAFPYIPSKGEGMDIRTYMATQIASGMFASSDEYNKGIAVSAVEMADKLIESLNEN